MFGGANLAQTSAPPSGYEPSGRCCKRSGGCPDHETDVCGRACARTFLDICKFLVCETLAAFVAAAVEHGASGLAGHARKETVLAGAVAFLGLVCSFWHYSLLSRFFC